MAQRVIRTYTCDMPHDASDVEAEGTTVYQWDGAPFEIDLCKEHYDQFLRALEPFLDASRKQGTGGGAPRPSTASGGGAARASAAAHRSQIEAVRKWARDSGFAVKDRGRIPARIMEAWQQAHLTR